MAAYLEETSRSFPNPISSQEFTKPFKRPSSGRYRSHSSQPDLGTGSNYYITFENGGPGSMPLGKDIVHYIGDNDPQCVANCDGGERQPVYRFYRSDKKDHKYSSRPELTKKDLGAENESWERAAKGYSKQPRNGKPVFYVLDKAESGAVPLKLWYSYWPDNTMLTVGSATPPAVGSGQGQYKEIGTIGYVYTNPGAVPNLTPLYHYRKGNYSAYYGKDIDDFYTVNPAKEVNLKGGPIAPKRKMKEEYDYQGILCYVFLKDVEDAPVKVIRDIGKIGPTGQCIDKSGWYQFQPTGPFSYIQYRITGETPGVVGFGNPDNASLISADANFEWYYGLNGAIKGAVPRFLGFEDSYDSQFYYYLYDTTFPWNGPLFGIQYKLNDIPCCPNTMCGEDPCCVPNYEYYSHFYEIRQDSWQTTKTRINISDISTFGVNESFSAIDTDSRRVLFRYVGMNTTARFNRGDTINGWDISSVVYYGDQLKAGLMELNGTGGAFTYKGQYTSASGATVEILAGYGIPNKAAFAGVYEFPKKISYYRVEIDPAALIPNRTLDQAEAEAIVGKDGSIKAVKMINGGRGYKNPIVEAINPRVMEDFGAGDLSKFMADGVTESGGNNRARSFKTPDASYTIENNNRDTWQSYGVFSGDIAFAEDKNRKKFKLKKAKLQVAEIDDYGAILKIRVVDGGSGYSQAEKPSIQIVEPETAEFQSPYSDNSEGKTFSDLGGDMVRLIGKTVNLNETQTGYLRTSVGIAGGGPAGINASFPTGYIRTPDLSDTDFTDHCFDVPGGCMQTGSAGTLASNVRGMQPIMDAAGKISPALAILDREAYSIFTETAEKSDKYLDDLNSVYGAYGNKRCIRTPQPKLYNVSRWFDMPCAYLDIGSDNKRKAYGFMPYKYCASKQREADFRVGLEIEGKVIGSMGPQFMDFLDAFKKPKLTPKRKVPGGYKSWKCLQGSVKGRCYRDPTNQNDIIFVPVGLDENTFDYNRQGYSEYEQFYLWLGDNLTGGSLSSGTTSWQWSTTTTTTNPDGSSSSTTTSNNGSNTYTAFTVDCQPNPANTNQPNHECWDTFVRNTGAPSDAPLDVYCGYDNQGNGLPGLRFWEIAGPTGVVNPFCSACGPSGATGFTLLLGGGPPAVGLDNVNDVSIAIDPQRIYNYGGGKVMQMGPYDGVMTVRNWLSGGVNALQRTINNLGNPYFDECEGVPNAWTLGQELNDEF